MQTITTRSGRPAWIVLLNDEEIGIFATESEAMSWLQVH
jgi:hypothetical protein